jgi:hypothetical protein
MSESAGAHLQVRAIRNALRDEAANALQETQQLRGSARLLEAAMALRALA